MSRDPGPNLSGWIDSLWTAGPDASDWWQMNAFVNYMLERIVKLDARSAKEARITERQHKVLLFVKGAPVADADGWVPLPFLRGCLLADTATAAQLVGRMRVKGLVSVKRPRRNGPAFVRLTPAGEATLSEVARRNAEALKDLAAEVGAEKMPAVFAHMVQYLEAGPTGVPASSRTRP